MDFTCNIVEQSQRICACGHDYVRPKQRDCLHCHKMAQRTFRAREKQRKEAASRLALEAIALRAAQGETHGHG